MATWLAQLLRDGLPAVPHVITRRDVGSGFTMSNKPTHARTRVVIATAFGIVAFAVAPPSHPLPPSLTGALTGIAVLCTLVAGMIPGPGRRMRGRFRGSATGDAWDHPMPGAAHHDPLPFTDQDTPAWRRLQISHYFLASLALALSGGLTILHALGGGAFNAVYSAYTCAIALTLAIRIGLPWTLLCAMTAVLLATILYGVVVGVLVVVASLV
jgi:hypothetical protein